MKKIQAGHDNYYRLFQPFIFWTEGYYRHQINQMFHLIVENLLGDETKENILLIILQRYYLNYTQNKKKKIH